MNNKQLEKSMKRLIRETQSDGLLHPYIQSSIWTTEYGYRTTILIPKNDLRDKPYKAVIKLLRSQLIGQGTKAIAKIVDDNKAIKLILTWCDDAVDDSLFQLRLYEVTKSATIERYNVASTIRWSPTAAAAS